MDRGQKKATQCKAADAGGMHAFLVPDPADIGHNNGRGHGVTLLPLNEITADEDVYTSEHRISARDHSHCVVDIVQCI